MPRKNGVPFLWRGMLGGLIGSFLGIGILYLYYFQHVGRAAYWGFFAITRVLPLTVVCGTLIGALVWGGTKLLRTRKLPGAVIGAISAAIIGSIAGAMIDIQTTNQNPDTIWHWFFIWYGLVAGAVTGAVSGAHDHRNT